MVVSDTIRTFYSSGSAIRKMFEEGIRLKAMHGDSQVADMSLGNPEFEPPEAFTEALRAVALEKGRHGYMPNAGYPEVRNRVALQLRNLGYFPTIGPEHIVMTAGAAGALHVVFKTILAPGERVIVPRPYFVEYRFYIDTHRGQLHLVDTRPDFELDVDRIADALDPTTRAVLVTSPNNPTGRVYHQDTLRDLAALLTDRSARYGKPVFLISDEPYREILFTDSPYTSPASTYRNSFMCYSWSKSFSIAGERIGYLAVNPEMEADDWSVLLGSLSMCNRFLGYVNAPAFMQHVIGACLDAPPVTQHYRLKREMLCTAFREAGYEFIPPDGSFYAFPKCPEPERTFVDRARDALLLVVPGSAFGSEGHFRISFACPTETVALACTKLAELMRR